MTRIYICICVTSAPPSFVISTTSAAPNTIPTGPHHPQFGTHYRMGALSGGQKVKVSVRIQQTTSCTSRRHPRLIPCALRVKKQVVVGAAMWNQPHIVILDEPTNYLDRDSLGALANAIIVSNVHITYNTTTYNTIMHITP